MLVNAWGMFTGFARSVHGFYDVDNKCGSWCSYFFSLLQVENIGGYIRFSSQALARPLGMIWNNLESHQCVGDFLKPLAS